MILDFHSLSPAVVPHFKGGEGEAQVRTAVSDGMGRILTLTLPVGSSIGLHTHTGNCEIIHVLSGSGVCHDDGTDVPLTAGMTQYCPEGHTHGIDNTAEDTNGRFFRAVKAAANACNGVVISKCRSYRAVKDGDVSRAIPTTADRCRLMSRFCGHLSVLDGNFA